MRSFSKFLLKAIILLAAIFLSRVIFQFPIELFNLHMFDQSSSTRIFSKIDMLKVISFTFVLFALFYRKKLDSLKHPAFSLTESMIYIFFAESFVLLYYLIRYLDNSGLIRGYFSSFFSILFLLLSFSSLVLGIFGKKYLKRLFTALRTEIIAASLVSLLFYFILMEFQKKWLIFSGFVARALFLILDRFYQTELFMGSNGPSLLVDDFFINIGAPCSGIDSMLLFFVFSCAIFALDHKKLNKPLFFVFSIFGLAGIITINILRLFFLIMVGVHISEDLAVGLFHTNAGWVMFVGYFLFYYWTMRTFIYNGKKTKIHER